MDIAGLNVRITIQKNAVTKDKYGNHLNEWVDYFSCYATVSDSTGSDSEKAGHTVEDETVNFTVRYSSETARVTESKYRIIFNGYIYDIEHIDKMGFHKRSLKFKTRRTER